MRIRRLMVIAALGLAVRLAGAQKPATPGERAELQGRVSEAMALRSRLVDQADTALAREMGREKAGDCQDAVSTYDVNVCLGKEVAKTTANYKTYVTAVRGLLAWRYPSPREEPPSIGPSGTEKTADELVKMFDDAQNGWDKYRVATCALAFANYQGGTIAPSVGMRCDLRVMWSHMRDLDYLFGEQFHR